MRCLRLPRIPKVPAIGLLAVASLFVTTSIAGANPLANQERQARQLAVEILEALSPLEDWLETPATAAEVKEESMRVVQVTGSRVNVRNAPSTDSRVIGVAERGDEYEYIDFDGEWYFIQMDDTQRAYISAEFSELHTKLVPATGAAAPARQFTKQMEPRARVILGQQSASVKTLGRISQTAQQSYEAQFGGDDSPEQRVAQKSLRRIQKYSQRAAQQYNSYARLVGEVKPIAKSSTRPGPVIRGTVRAGVGTNTAETEVVGSGTSSTDVTRLNLDADLWTKFSSADKLRLLLGYEEEIRFAPTTRLRGAVDYSRQVSDVARVGSRVGFDNYHNKVNDLTDVDRTEFSVRGRVTPSKKFHAQAGAVVASASYPNNDTQDYKETRLNLGAGGQASRTVRWAAKLALTSRDLDDNTYVEDNNRNTIEASVQFRTGERSTLSLIGQSEGNSFDSKANVANYTRRGLKLESRSRGLPGNSRVFELEIRQKSYDAIDDRNFTEFRGAWNAIRGTAGKPAMKSLLSINYRNFKGSESAAYLDYLEARFDFFRSRAGIFGEADNYGQYFFEQDDFARNARLNQFLWLGLLLGSNGAIQVGPHAGITTELVTVDGAVDAQGNELGTFESPNNSVRYGVKGSARFTVQAIKIRVSGRYEKTNFYNLDGAPSPAKIEFESNLLYNISRLLDASARAKYYSTGADEPGSTKTNELDILFAIVYRIGG